MKANSHGPAEALLGLTDICTNNPTLMVSSLGQIVNGLLKLFIDDDREVRKSTLNYLQETFVDIEKVELQPFMPILIMYTCSAMTHIFEDVRTDAVKFLNLWIQIAPETVVSKFWNRITGNYMSLLSVDANNQQIGSVSMGKNITTASIKAAATKSHLHIHKDKFWFFLNYLDSKHARESFKRKMEKYNSPNTEEVIVWDMNTKNAFTPLHPLIYSTAPNLSEGYKLATFSHLHLFESSGPKNNTTTNTPDALEANELCKDDRLDSIEKMIEAFQPMLVASWLEAAPSVFISTNTIAMTPALELVYEILKISVIMWRAAVSSQKVSTLSASWLDRHLQTTLRHFHVYFPFGADALGNRGSKVDDVLMQMNILFCELTSLYLLARTMQKNNLRLESRKTMPESNMAPEWTQNVVGHVLGVLGCDGQDEVMSSTSSSFRAEHLVSLLPAIWGFLNYSSDSSL
ncbi:hypothetical protein RO3G_13631 [Rhizopus delemar RA 99-880]|uniref:Pre-rRNA-processing protein n=1 Tax=Rhizopus delemar (strain RA 99-880 / ATCC MYA-4621 / FGSC 9543 / NRRL 43880) TaxID=246409 RepID=I1CKE0_RHIO9|nr:hypothetical protein RO3G_13631 [Rhizopus delemar RA 99-880]|eukprot:EIE88920.1 hypothetical protein RO3G_13631 [Rhizopus delemar RA 99-880]